ncbi:glycosyltransferase [Acidicapsa dinghuensis]|uniref:Glycosyltransferase n=1 Tax=Acidicapsa dinghuensis TaxID=2218256 RepID=A0ABW1ELN2_9BACT|nr:glycosyltransferase [Acidicapsa dinghuensis]
MTRIVYIIPTLDRIGGAERQLLLLAKAFASRGWHVSVIALSGNGSDAAHELRNADVFFYSLYMRKAWLDPLGWIRYQAWRSIHKPDIVHAHLDHASFFARFARIIAPVPVLIDTIHTIHTGSRLRRFLMRQTCRLSSHVTCVANSVADAYNAAGLLPHHSMSVIPNAIDIRQLPAVRNSPESTPHPFLWVAVGRLHTVKDYPTLLRAFALLPGEPRLTIAGAGPDQTRLVDLAHSLGIEDRVHFAGFIANVWPLLAASDAFVLTSLWEGLPVSILEASAAGLPVVATQTEGATEALRTCDAKWLVPIGDHLALAEAMAAVMILSPAERSEISNQNRKTALEQYALPVIADRWTNLYLSLLEKHSTRR